MLISRQKHFHSQKKLYLRRKLLKHVQRSYIRYRTTQSIYISHFALINQRFSTLVLLCTRRVESLIVRGFLFFQFRLCIQRRVGPLQRGYFGLVVKSQIWIMPLVLHLQLLIQPPVYSFKTFGWTKDHHLNSLFLVSVKRYANIDLMLGFRVL